MNSRRIAIKEGLPRSEKFMRGWVEIWKKRKDENKFKHHSKSNLIVYVGREYLLPRIFDVNNTSLSNPADSAKDYAIYWISFGEGGAPAGDPLNPTPPTNSDTALASEITIGNNPSVYADAGKKHPIDAVVFQTDSNNDDRYLIAQVQATLDETEANGSGQQNLNEAALWISNSNDPSTADKFLLFARATFPTIVKDANLTLQILWYIYS